MTVSGVYMVILCLTQMMPVLVLHACNMNKSRT